MKSIEELEKKINKIKEENQEFKKIIADLKKEKKSLLKDCRDKDVVYNNTPAGIVLILQGKIIEANDTFLKIIGYESSEVINQNYLDFIDPGYLTDVRIIHKKWDAEKIKQGQYDTGFLTKTGFSVVCSIESKRARYRGRASYLLNITSLEARKKEEASKEKEIKDRIISDMINGFMRELERNTASIMKMAALANNETETVKKLKVLITKIESLANNLVKQIHMLKTINDDNREYVEKERVNINTVIEDEVNSLLDSINEEQNKIIINTYFRSSTIIEGNPDDFKEAFAQILFYLTENMDEEDSLLITTEENSDFAYIYIQDNSEGKGEESAENLFYPYYEANRIGLAYSKAVINRHNGTLEAITGKGEGVIFQIILPLAPEPVAKKIDKSRLKNSRILIIQNDDIARDLMSHLLADRGCRLDTSDSFLEGLAKIKKNKIDMVIADIDSIEMDMNNFIKKCITLKPKMLTVFIGDRKGEIDMDRNVSITPDLFISKPLEIKSAVKKISRLLMTEK